MSEQMTRRRTTVRPGWTSWSAFAGDSFLYAVAAIFALGMGLFSNATAQSHWGFLATAPYAVAAVLSLALAKTSLSSEHWTRVGLVGLVVLGAVLVPLAMEVHWRTEQPARGFAQPEVPVIERAASDIAQFDSPYQSYWRDGHLVNAVPRIPSYESFFPYFPLMGVFGLPHAESKDPTPVSDARVVMTIMTMITGGVALWLMRSSPRQKIRVAQLLIALPTGALFLATGGDDMPILALSLLGIVALQRRSHHVAGISLGLAAAMKLTAWPLTLGALLVAHDEEGHCAWRRVALWAASILAVTIIPFAVTSPFAFLSNVVAFPLGLAHVASPAASPLPGHLLTALWAPLGHLLTPLTLLVGGYLATKHVRRHWPLDLARLLMLLAAFSTALICVASATRVGYLIYPLNFALWSRACVVEPVVHKDLVSVV